MALPPSFESALALIASRLASADFAWAITGSLGMRLQGMALEPRDIDLQSTRDGALRTQALFPEYVSQPVIYKPSERIHSWFGAMEIDGIPVEIMGDMEKLRPDGLWEPAPDLSSVICWVVYQDLRLPVLDLNYEYESYRMMGREAKAERIRAFLDR